MKFKKIFLIFFLMIFQGCMSISMLAIDDKNAIGKSLEKVTASITKKGLICGEEYTIKDLGGKPYGLVICGATGGAPICPTSYSVRIIFDLDTRVVYSLSKSERESCF